MVCGRVLKTESLTIFGVDAGNNAEGRKVDAAPKAELRPTSAAQSRAARGTVSSMDAGGHTRSPFAAGSSRSAGDAQGLDPRLTHRAALHAA
eukprot:402482-Rhodomonas_salina.1